MVIEPIVIDGDSCCAIIIILSFMVAFMGILQDLVLLYYCEILHLD